jgi:signal transduction histidine kinase
MTTGVAYLRELYAISLSTRPGESLEASARRTLTAYVEQLPCRTAALYETTPGGYRHVATQRRGRESGPLSDPDEQRLAAVGDQFPQTGRTADGAPFYLLEVPDFGVLVLVTTEQLDEELIVELAPLAEQLGAVCRASQRLDSASEPDDGSHRRTVEQFYDELERVFAADSREEICKLAMAATDEIVGAPNASIHLYDRSTEMLVPVAATIDRAVAGGPDSYTDRESVVWQVYQTGEPVVIEDTSAFNGKLPHGETPVDSAVVLPLGDHGVLIVSAFERMAFDSADLSVLRLFCRLVEVALDRYERIERLEGVQEITRSAIDGESHEAIAQQILDQVPDVLDFPLSAIWKYDATSETLRPLAATPKSDELFGENPSFSDDNSLAWRAFQNTETYAVSDFGTQTDAYNEETPLGSEIIVPIGEFGVLATGSTHAESFSAAERRLVETLAANVETAMRLADRRQELALLDQVLARILRHNIRNELNIIQGYATQILETADDESTALAAQIIESCGDLETTAEHAREMQAIVRTRDSRAAVDLRPRLQQTAELVRAEYPDATITTALDADPEIVVHPELMTAIRHLLENSIEHHEGPETPTVDVTLWRADSGNPVVEIADDGPGIPQSEIDILDRHGESALEHGSGAGLWLVDRVVEYSGGSLEFDSSPEGTVVTIRFES